MYKLCVFVPESHLEQVKDALFRVGAGRYENYDCCAWQTKGMGQFRPLVGSQPYIGVTNQIDTIAEYKVEMICADELIKPAIAALRQAHPYEEPAFDLYPLVSVD